MTFRTRISLPAMLLGALVVSGCGAAAAATSTASSGGRRSLSPSRTATGAVRLAKVAISDGTQTLHQKVLVSADGRAIYLLTGDSTAHPQCVSSACLSSWPAATSAVRHPRLGSGVSGRLTVWKHKGLRQLVLNGHPLYHFSGDSGAAVANGNDLKSFGGTWHVMDASGQIAKLSTTSTGGGW